MGCDIHIFAERRNPATKKWEKVGSEFLNSWHLGEIAEFVSNNMGISNEQSYAIATKYAKGKEPSDKIEEYVIGQLLPSMVLSKDDPMNWWEAKEAGKLPYPYSDQPYDGRCYTLFGVLAGVRDTMVEPMDYPRDIPDDTSDEIRSGYEGWGMDAHSSSHYYLDELLDSRYRNMSADELREEGIDPYFFKTMLDDALDIVEDPRDLRFIFWFDS